MTTNKKPNIDIGSTYMTTDGVPVTTLKSISSDAALFVSEEFHPTPFVIWQYNLVSDNIIELYRGQYFRTLDDALSSLVEDAPTITLSLYCPGCEDTTTITVDLHQSVQSMMEQIEDNNFCCQCHGRTGGAYKIQLTDENTSYHIPLWKGPVTSV